MDSIGWGQAKTSGIKRSADDQDLTQDGNSLLGNSANPANKNNKPLCSPYSSISRHDQAREFSKPYEPNLTPVKMSEVERAHPEIEHGGRYSPRHCRMAITSRLNKMAIVVPFRNREQHLAVLLNSLHSLLVEQNQQYRIFVINQTDDHAFNRGMLNNVGFLEAGKINTFSCFIFHDVDLIPTTGKNLYHCPIYPLHMSSFMEKAGKSEAGEDKAFAGVGAVHPDVYLAANGFSNKYWGWGGEDNDFYRRLQNLGYGVLRHSKAIGTYRMLPHMHEEPNPGRHELLATWKMRLDRDGVRATKYDLINVKSHPLFTEISVKLRQA